MTGASARTKASIKSASLISSEAAVKSNLLSGAISSINSSNGENSSLLKSKAFPSLGLNISLSSNLKLSFAASLPLPRL